MILWLSYLHNGISYNDKMTSLYWIRVLIVFSIIHYLAHYSLVMPYGDIDKDKRWIRQWLGAISQYWLITKGVLWHSAENNLIRNADEINQKHALEYYSYKIITTSPRGQLLAMVNIVFVENMQICTYCLQLYYTLSALFALSFVVAYKWVWSLWWRNLYSYYKAFKIARIYNIYHNDNLKTNMIKNFPISESISYR